MNKNKFIQIRIDVNTKESIQKKAKKQNKSLSQYILDKVLTNNNNCIDKSNNFLIGLFKLMDDKDISEYSSEDWNFIDEIKEYLEMIKNG